MPTIIVQYLKILWLCQGCTWRRRNGRSVHNWNDHLLPEHHKLSWTNYANFIGEVAIKVSDLIDSCLRWSNVNKVHTIFSHSIAIKISRIVILPIDQLGRFIWSKEKSVIFSMKSAYQLINEDMNQHVGESSNADCFKPLWKTLYKMNVPNKIKVMAWRACHKSLPTMQQPHHKRVTMENKCCFCNSKVEDAAHALVFSQIVWEHWMKLVPSITHLDKDISFKDIEIRVYKEWGTKTLETLTVVAWIFWYRQNKWLHEKLSLHPARPLSMPFCCKKVLKIWNPFHV